MFVLQRLKVRIQVKCDSMFRILTHESRYSAHDHNSILTLKLTPSNNKLTTTAPPRFSNCSFSLILGLAMCGEVLGTLLYMLVTSALAHLLSDAVMLYILAVPPCITFLLSMITL